MSLEASYVFEGVARKMNDSNLPVWIEISLLLFIVLIKGKYG